MTFRARLKLYRVLVLVLLFNSIAPAVMAGDKADSGSVLLCTSAGLIKVQLADLGSANSLITQSSNSDQQGIEASATTMRGEHCPYCQLHELPDGAQSHLAPYPAPDAHVALHYRRVLPTDAALYGSFHAHLRAPPSNTLL